MVQCTTYELTARPGATNTQTGLTITIPQRTLVMANAYLRHESARRNTLSRRTALTGALLAAVMPSEAVADPHPAWLEEWRTLDQRFTDANSDEEARTLVPRLNQLIELIVDTPATTPEGMIAKIQAIREDTRVSTSVASLHAVLF
ncbi:MAG: hypothetical protein AAF950_17130 [Pseudomonadota bacterium]